MALPIGCIIWSIIVHPSVCLYYFGSIIPERKDHINFNLVDILPLHVLLTHTAMFGQKDER